MQIRSMDHRTQRYDVLEYVEFFAPTHAKCFPVSNIDDTFPLRATNSSDLATPTITL